MFTDGLHNRADIFRITRAESNMGEMSITRLTPQPSLTDVPCRIIKDSKILFEQGIELADGDTIRDCATGTVYEVSAARLIYGQKAPHHRSYTVRIKRAAPELAEGEA